MVVDNEKTKSCYITDDEDDKDKDKDKDKDDVDFKLGDTENDENDKGDEVDGINDDYEYGDNEIYMGKTFSTTCELELSYTMYTNGI
ncbi:hypothetical protein MKX01_041363, partial [Papaver californicum]